MIIETSQELNCPICMGMFKIPITTECGHSFCRNCLINSSKNKKVCPICRQEFQSNPQKLKQDEALAHILQDIRTLNIQAKEKQQSVFQQSKSETMLLLNVKTSELLLPYNKIHVTFQLQSPLLLNKRQKIVAKQESPYDKFGVISKIVALNKIRHNVYECTLQGKAFCLIQQESVEQNEDLQQEEFSYRLCRAKQIIQTSYTNPKHLLPFVYKLKEIKSAAILHKIYSQIDHNVLTSATDPQAMIYSIFGIIDIQQQQKYKILTQFNEELRVQCIKKVVEKVQNIDVSDKVKGFVKVKIEQGNSFMVIFIILAVFGFLWLMNKGDLGQL